MWRIIIKIKTQLYEVKYVAIQMWCPKILHISNYSVLNCCCCILLILLGSVVILVCKGYIMCYVIHCTIDIFSCFMISTIWLFYNELTLHDKLLNNHSQSLPTNPSPHIDCHYDLLSSKVDTLLSSDSSFSTTDNIGFIVPNISSGKKMISLNSQQR